MHKILKIVIGILIFLVIFVIVGLVSINNLWKSRIDENELVQVSDKINKTEPLPLKFYAIHDEMFPGLRSRGAIYGLMNLIREELKEYGIEDNPFSISIYKKSSPTMWVYSNLVDNRLLEPIGDSVSVGGWFAVALGQYSKPEKCFDFFYKNHRYEIGLGDSIKFIRGIDDYSKRLYDKSIENLSNSELRKIILSVENDKKFKILTTPHLY